MDALVASLSDPQLWIAFFTLTALELVLGIDNIIFISILVDKLPPAKREIARRIGLFLAMFMRVGLLVVLSWLVGLTTPLFTVIGTNISGRDLILIAGGVFLVWKATREIHQLTEGEEGHASDAVHASFAAIIVQVILIDVVFSLDSVGMMMLFARGIGNFVSSHPSIKMLALSFLLLVGVMLIAEGFGHKMPKGYIYFAMAFSVAVEMLNIRMRKKKSRPTPVELHEPYKKS
jgi:predicted tellurium resistance membrane protein TerC